ncbi:MAG: paraquat-inducible protein A [Opitutus sp.]
MPSLTSQLACPLCGQVHRPTLLEPGQRALCVRCDAVLARGSRFGRDATLVFTLTGLILAVPALLLPFITAGKFGQSRGGLLITAVDGLWSNNMPVLGFWVLLCGAAVPILLLVILAVGLLPPRLGWKQRPHPLLSSAAHALSYWAIPEVQVLAVLVALMKLGALVTVTIGFGFWAYIGMSLSVLLAWRNFMLNPPEVAVPEPTPDRQSVPDSVRP